MVTEKQELSSSRYVLPTVTSKAAAIKKRADPSKTCCVYVYEYLPETDGTLTETIEVHAAIDASSIPDVKVVASRMQAIFAKVEVSDIPIEYKGILCDILDRYITVRVDNVRMMKVQPQHFTMSDSKRWGDSLLLVELAAKGRMAETLDFVDKLLNFPVNIHVMLCARRIAYDLHLPTPGPLPFQETCQSKILFARLMTYVRCYSQAYKKRVLAAHAITNINLPDGSIVMVQL